MVSQKPVILITGAAGRLGSAIIAALGDDYTIVGFERKCPKTPFDCIEADIGSDEGTARACAQLRERYGSRIASVIHLAAFYDFSGEDNPLYESVTVQGTARLLRALQGFEVEQFVYASTMLVHAPSEPGSPINEDSPIEPKWAYPQSKVRAEHEVRTQRGDIPAVILRIAGVYTDYCEVPSLATQMQRIYERQMQSRVFPGNASHGQAFVHIEDVAAAFKACVERRGRLPEETAILIGEPVTESYEAMQNLLGRLIHGEPWHTREIPKSVARTGAWLEDKMEAVIPDAIDRGIEPFIKPFMVDLADDHYELDITRARTLLDWNPQHRLRRCLPMMVGELRQNP
ncbi:MAG TPA: NAD(P)-dependent oxidoreductase, partial [Noviherbaspirillum sp.]|nr:NAD(P)-dependent oxidoreductase [Noviherbaspirillum sp.]